MSHRPRLSGVKQLPSTICIWVGVGCSCEIVVLVVGCVLSKAGQCIFILCVRALQGGGKGSST